jgi:hypothetical protein
VETQCVNLAGYFNCRRDQPNVGSNSMAESTLRQWVDGWKAVAIRRSVDCDNSMNSPLSNIEAVARDICHRQLFRPGMLAWEIAADVDRYWHCVAAQLESGQIDETGKQLEDFNLDQSLAAYRDWCGRHPETMPTRPMRPPSR